MYKSLAYFTNKLFDYAGLFPPENLSLSKSLWNFSQYQTFDQREWLGKFIFPVEKVEEFISFLSSNPNYFENFTHPAIFSVILSKTPQGIRPLQNLSLNLHDVDQMRQTCGSLIQISSFEILPQEDILISNNREIIFSYLEKLHQRLVQFEPTTEIYLEVPFMNESGSFFLESVSEYNKTQTVSFAVKLRTGGVKPDQIPSAHDLAHAIFLCAKLGIPIKFTAGLHSAIPHFDKEVGATLHGFLNVISIAILCYSDLYFMKNLGIQIKDLEHMLAHFHGKDFRFIPDGLFIGSHFVGNELLSEIRTRFVKGIGTCSFLEPIEHLKDSELDII